MNHKPTDIHPVSFEYGFLPVEMRMPLKFGGESVSHVNCLRVAAEVVDSAGRRAEGWGETPLSVTWAWPSATLSYDERYEAMVAFCKFTAQAFVEVNESGHPMEIGHVFLAERLPLVLEAFNKSHSTEPIPYLAALIVVSAFDIALHDAYGNLHQIDIYDTYTKEYMTQDLSHYFRSSPEADRFQGLFPSDFLEEQPSVKVPVWHLVGGLDPLEESDKKESDPKDGYPVTLTEWIKSDGLRCLKIKHDPKNRIRNKSGRKKNRKCWKVTKAEPKQNFKCIFSISNCKLSLCNIK